MPVLAKVPKTKEISWKLDEVTKISSAFFEIFVVWRSSFNQWIYSGSRYDFKPELNCVIRVFESKYCNLWNESQNHNIFRLKISSFFS